MKSTCHFLPLFPLATTFSRVHLTSEAIPNPFERSHLPETLLPTLASHLFPLAQLDCPPLERISAMQHIPPAPAPNWQQSDPPLQLTTPPWKASANLLPPSQASLPTLQQYCQTLGLSDGSKDVKAILRKKINVWKEGQSGFLLFLLSSFFANQHSSCLQKQPRRRLLSHRNLRLVPLAQRRRNEHFPPLPRLLRNLINLRLDRLKSDLLLRLPRVQILYKDLTNSAVKFAKFSAKHWMKICEFSMLLSPFRNETF